MEQQKSSGLIIYYIEQNQPIFLILKKTNRIDFVKGLIEETKDGEEAEIDTALREAKEEANLTELEIIPNFEHKQEFFFELNEQFIKKQLVYHLAKTTKEHSKQTKISYEHKGFDWLVLKQALKLMRIKGNKEVIQKAHDFILEFEKQKKLPGF